MKFRAQGADLGVGLLVGSWDLVTFNWAHNPTYNAPKWAYRGYPIYKQGYNPRYKYLGSPMGLQVGFRVWGVR